MLYKSFSTTATGISHAKHGKGCEDFSFHYPPYQHISASPLALAVVADGHGDDNCFRSAKGAEFAVTVAKDAIIEFTDRLRPRLLQIIKLREWPSREIFERYIRDMVKHIIAEWHGKVEQDYTDNPIKDGELANVGEKYRKRYVAGQNLHHAYGTTLIAVVITKEYWLGVHIGDGRFTALYPDGRFAQPVPWDDRCYLNVTTSICDDDAFERARTYYAPASNKLPAAVFLCSDGVDDNYPVEENEKHLYKLYRTIALTFVDDGFDSTCGQLKDLANSFATNGKGDDTSIAGIIDLEAVKAIAPQLRKQVEADDQKAAAEKAEIAARVEKVRLATEKAAAERVKATKAEATKPAAEKRAVEQPIRGRPSEKEITAESVRKSIAIKNARAVIEAYEKHKAPSSGSDPEIYGVFVTNEDKTHER
ncbi:MAG: protein phosphatase 2C domain-containing protein [Spirochaetaceae bacterium]|jgi:serine/threonine protein phosphatase PrpC|nr:protein phosphatase 2C domain-containing protein [Spirochaetaceae bacterium]